jgi:hypothetical protein
MAHEISLAMSVGSFALVVGFLTGYAVRAYFSHLHRRRTSDHHTTGEPAPCGIVH